MGLVAVCRRYREPDAGMIKEVSNLPTMTELVEQGITQGLHSGAQVYVSMAGEVVADMAFGQALPGVEMTTDTLMVWLSAGKPITAVAIAQQWEDGDLDLDAPVAQYVPEFAQHGKDVITIRHLLTHMGGFRAEPYRFPDDTWDTIIAKLCAARLEPNWVPGQDAGYHALSSWFILGEVLERITEEPFRDYIRRRILEPADMWHSWMGVPRDRYDELAGQIGLLENTYPHAPQPGVQHFHEREHITRTKPGGGMVGPIRELGKFYEMLLRGGEVAGRRILEPETVELFTAPHRTGIYDKTFRHTIDWGLGFILDSKHHGQTPIPYGFGQHASSQTFGHGGMQSSTGFADPEHQLAVAIIFNGMPGEPRHMARNWAVLSALYEDLGLA